MTTDALLTPPSEALAILRRLRQTGHESYLCGGCVRDALLGEKPKDYDIVTAATPDQVEALFPKTVPIGKAFGVILVIGETGVQYEIATFRADLGYADGRHPDAVRFSSAEEDAKRRDFTLNALFYDPFADRVIDFVGGREDIRRRVLRTVGDPAKRFTEDHLRLLRAVRFAARTGFAIEETTGRAVADMARLVRTVSPERIAAELEAMLLHGYSGDAFAMLKDLALLKEILPEADAMFGVAQPPDFHPEGDVWFHTLLLLEENDLAVLGRTPALDFENVVDVDLRKGMHRGDFTGEQYLDGVRECRAAFSASQERAVAWAGLLHDIGKPGTFTVTDRIRFNEHDTRGAEMAREVLERLRRPRRLIDSCYDLIRRHIHFSTLRKMRKSKLRRWLTDPSFPAHLELHRLDCVASHKMLANWHFGLESWREEKARPPEPDPLVRGSDLIAIGIKPGPEIGKALKKIDDARLEGLVSTREEALAMAREAAQAT